MSSQIQIKLFYSLSVFFLLLNKWLGNSSKTLLIAQASVI